jgi:hypothetical protein
MWSFEKAVFAPMSIVIPPPESGHRSTQQTVVILKFIQNLPVRRPAYSRSYTPLVAARNWWG